MSLARSSSAARWRARWAAARLDAPAAVAGPSPPAAARSPRRGGRARGPAGGSRRGAGAVPAPARRRSHRRVPRAPVDRPRARRPAAPAAVQRQHPLPVKVLAQRLLGRPARRARRGTSACRPAARSRSIACSAADRRGSSSRRISSAANGSVATSLSGGPRHSASASRGAPEGYERLEAKSVDVAAAQPQLVAATARDDLRTIPARRQRLAQLRHVDLHHLRRRRRRLFAPEAVDQPLGRRPPTRR